MRKRRDFGKRRAGSYVNDMIKKKMTKEKMKALDLKMKEYHFEEITGELLSRKWKLMSILQRVRIFKRSFEGYWK